GQGAGDLELFGRGHGSAGSLLAVAEAGVEDADVLGGGIHESKSVGSLRKEDEGRRQELAGAPVLPRKARRDQVTRKLPSKSQSPTRRDSPTLQRRPEGRARRERWVAGDHGTL